MTPPLGSFGQLINITGNGFGMKKPNSLIVKFNNTLSTTNTNNVVGDSLIQAPVPTNSTTGFVSVQINGGPVINSTNQFFVISTNAYVTNFSPLFGGPNTTVVLTGVNFLNATNVKFNGVVSKTTASTPFVQVNAITVTAPDGVTTGPLLVMTKNGHDFSTVSNQLVPSATNFFVQPVITSFSPTLVRPGTNFTIIGTNLTGITGVLFGGVNAVNFFVTNNNLLLAIVPTNTSTGGIQINSPYTGPGFSSSNYRMLPTIYSFSPNFGPVGTTVTVTGAGLNEQSPQPTVTVGGGTVMTFGTISANTLSFNVPATAATGLISITTSNGSISSTDLFYLPPSITSFTPIGGGAGTIVTITGNNLTNATAVSFNGSPASSFGATNNTTIGAIVPAGITSGTISVTTPGGTATSAAIFLGPPSVSGFAPTHGLPGTNVFISGMNFTNATAVLFNGTAATFTVTNNNTIGAIVPNGATTGPITVQSAGGTNSSAANFTIDSADIGIASVTALPNPVFVHSNLTYTIVVTNAGQLPASNVRLTNVLATSVTLKSASISQGLLNTNANPITGNFGTINNNSSATVTLTVAPNTVGNITNIAFDGSDLTDPNPANNFITNTTTVWPLPFLSITNLMSNNLMQVSWPAPLSGFTLQFNTNLSTNIWTSDGSSKSVSGTNVSVIETNIGTARFFRLTN
jgi:hypothetical protein